MEKLLFDLSATQPNNSGKRHGGGRYGEIVFMRLLERGFRFSCLYDSSRWLNPEIHNLCDANGIPMFDTHKNSVEDIAVTHGIKRIYSALPGKLAKRVKCCEVYGTIHGLREFETPLDNIFYHYRHTFLEEVKFTVKKIFRMSFLRRYKQKFRDCYINKTFHIITVSEHSKYALHTYFPELKDLYIPVFYSPNTSRKEKIEKNTQEKYFLLVSGNRWEKNNLRAIVAFDRLVSNGLMDKNIRMKITGAVRDQFRHNLSNPQCFDFLGYVDDDELERLYSNAHVFVYPSLNEGFGYPPLEAMRYGVPVIASPLSSIPEVCEGSVMYFNPFSIEEIMNRMLMILDSQTYLRFSQKGLLRYSEVKKKQDADLDLLIDYFVKDL